MNFRKSVAAVAVVMTFGLAAGNAAGSETIRNILPTAHGAPADASLEEISRAIEQAAGELQWYGASESAESIAVSTTVRQKHRATVMIGFDEANFWITYRNSSNLDYNASDVTMWTNVDKRVVVGKGPRIHKNYNVWVQDLANHIAMRTRLLLADQRSQSPSPSPALIADELEKLDQLRARGVLTQEEFDAQKAKLLAR